MKEKAIIFQVLFMNNFVPSEAFLSQLYLTDLKTGMTIFLPSNLRTS